MTAAIKETAYAVNVSAKSERIRMKLSLGSFVSVITSLVIDIKEFFALVLIMESVSAVSANVSALGVDPPAAVGRLMTLATLRIWMMLKFVPGMANVFAANVSAPRLTMLGILESIARNVR